MRHLNSLTTAGVTAIAAMLMAPLAQAQPQTYLGGSFGYYRFDHESFPSSSSEFEDDRGSWKIFVGAQPNPMFGFEVGYVDFGELSQNGAKFDSDGIQAAITAGIPFTPNFVAYGKLGQLFWDREIKTNIGSSSRDGDDTFYGVGTRIGVAPNLDVKLEYERFKIDRADVDMASVGLNLRF